MTHESLPIDQRAYSPLATPQAKRLVDSLSSPELGVDEYRQAMRALGDEMAGEVLAKMGSPTRPTDIYVVCTVEDADFLARGVIDRLGKAGLAQNVRLACMWNVRQDIAGVAAAPIIKSYTEKGSADRAVVIVVKAIIAGACVVKTNLSRMLSSVGPDEVFVVAPVLLKGAQGRLADEFPAEISRKFQFVWCAMDSRKQGDLVVPGVGGSVYERLGLGNAQEKNRYAPALVRERRSARGAPAQAVFAQAMS